MGIYFRELVYSGAYFSFFMSVESIAYDTENMTLGQIVAGFCFWKTFKTVCWKPQNFSFVLSNTVVKTVSVQVHATQFTFKEARCSRVGNENCSMT